FMEKMISLFGENPPDELTDPERMGYFALSPELLADQIVYAINQPWGVSISDITVRASGDGYVI
ncbi:MAG: NADP-dependent 3-hydroxy acid dehydrogenase YdfG, partial [Myxococcota bacterium]